MAGWEVAWEKGAMTQQTSFKKNSSCKDAQEQKAKTKFNQLEVHIANFPFLVDKC